MNINYVPTLAPLKEIDEGRTLRQKRWLLFLNQSTSVGAERERERQTDRQTDKTDRQTERNPSCQCEMVVIIFH